MEVNLHSRRLNDSEHTGLRVDEIGFGNIRILQDPCGFCYGADAVMVAWFAAEILGRTRNWPRRLCDLGTGNGIIPLILSHKLPSCNVTQSAQGWMYRHGALNSPGGAPK